jgi:hypothetical protein
MGGGRGAGGAPGKLGVRRHILTGFLMSIEKMGFLMVWSFLSAMGFLLSFRTGHDN